jgi:glycosyltransferase involved in cell wall biosynthesis
VRICIVGGIFDKPASYRSKHSISPETVLAAGLRERGWEVAVCGHRQPLPAGPFDVVHAHHFGRGSLRLAARGGSTPFVFTTHDPFAMNGLDVGWKRRLTDAFVLRRADRLVALSAAERDFLVKRYGLRESRVVVIPNGIETRVFDRASEPEQGGEAGLLFVAQLEEFKGLDYLLEAMPAIRAAHPQVKLRVVYQTAALLDRYRAHVERLGLTAQVDFAGPKTATELAQLYSTAAVCVSPSLGECLSTVVLEAMCCGAAVVATDVGGIREQLDAETGIIVRPRDAPALAKAICRLLADHTLRLAMGEAARRKTRAQFSVRKMIDRHVWLYEELLGADERAA